MQTKRIEYDDTVVRRFIFASILFGIVGMLVGVLAASQLAWWQANAGIKYMTFSRIRPLHTNAVIFAFVGNMMFAGIYYSMQRLLKTRMASDTLSRVHFWGWQLIIVAAAITLPLGITTSKEYAELEWPIDIAIAIVWVVFAVNFFWTIAKRNEKHLYVAIWFYISTVITVAVLHIVNSLALPLNATKSYSVYAGVQDALVQWWYGHNAVAFFLTTPILGIMYYFLPKAAERPVYSYRLSVIHFWALVFIYIWAGPHHLLNTALPEWAQSLGMLFSLMLWAPSWGGMLNGLLTLRGAWQKLREDPVLKFFAAGVTFYGMATLEGPLLSIKSVSALAHYTDWIIGHVHSGALGWNGFMAAGMFYWLVPRLYGTKLHSTRAADAHFWLGTIGIVLYVLAMWVSSAQQGLMWRATNPDGTLVYPSWVETVIAIRPMYIVRALGGTMYLTGFLMMAWNLWKTARAGKPVTVTTEVAVDEAAAPALVFADRHRRCELARLRAADARRAGDRLRRPPRGARLDPRRSRQGVAQPAALLVRDHRAQAAVIHGAHAHRDPDRRHGRAPPHAARQAGRPRSQRERAEAVHRPRAARARPLRARGLLRVPLPDGPDTHRGHRAVRRLFEARRVHLRPPLPVGLEAHRPRPPSPGRSLPEPLALRPPHGPALHQPRLEHAELPLARGGAHRRQAGAAEAGAHAEAGRALHQRRGRQRRDRAARPGRRRRHRSRLPGGGGPVGQRDGRAHQLPAAARA
jgi:cbb3-type cytochrome c oxidase subunit I